MKIGILGSGTAGQTLGRGFIRLGHWVRIGTRDPLKLADWQASSGEQASISSVEGTAAWAEIIILSVYGPAVEEVLNAAGSHHFAGKVLIDASDPLDFSSGKPGLFVGTTDSLGEKVQRLLPEAKVVKAFNTVAAEVMIEPALSGNEPDMFIAGNDESAKQMVSGLLEAFGWNVVDFGGIENARWLEAISVAWVVYSHKTGNWRHSFKLLGK